MPTYNGINELEITLKQDISKIYAYSNLCSIGYWQSATKVFKNGELLSPSSHNIGYQGTGAYGISFVTFEDHFHAGDIIKLVRTSPDYYMSVFF